MGPVPSFRGPDANHTHEHGRLQRLVKHLHSDWPTWDAKDLVSWRGGGGEEGEEEEKKAKQIWRL